MYFLVLVQLKLPLFADVLVVIRKYFLLLPYPCSKKTVQFCFYRIRNSHFVSVLSSEIKPHFVIVQSWFKQHNVNIFIPVLSPTLFPFHTFHRNHYTLKSVCFWSQLLALPNSTSLYEF